MSERVSFDIECFMNFLELFVSLLYLFGLVVHKISWRELFVHVHYDRLRLWYCDVTFGKHCWDVHPGVQLFKVPRIELCALESDVHPISLWFELHLSYTKWCDLTAIRWWVLIVNYTIEVSSAKPILRYLIWFCKRNFSCRIDHTHFRIFFLVHLD